MPRRSTGHTQRATSTKPTKHSKPLHSTEPRQPPKQTPEVVAAIYYFGAFRLSETTISKLVLSKYPHAENVRTEDCYNRVVWLSDYLARKGLPFTRTSVGKPVKDAVPFIGEVNFITEIDEQCAKILQRHPSSVLKELKDHNNIVRAAIMNEFSAEEHSEYEMWRKTAESMFRSRPLPQDNLLPPGSLAYGGDNIFLGHWPPEH